MRIVRMARPVHLMTLRPRKQHVSTGIQSADIAPETGDEARLLGRAFFSQRIGLPPVTA